jgi:hypothetical protein
MFMFEQPFSRPQEKPPVSIQKAVELYESHLVSEGGGISMDDFASVYTVERIQRDKMYVEKRKRDFENDSPLEKISSAYATALEAVIYEHIELSEWFGSNTRTIKTTAYDDVANGVDLLLEINPNLPLYSPSHVALGIDVTFGALASMDKKFSKLKELVISGTLACVNYFQTEDFKGEMRNIPEVIVGCSKELVGELAVLYVTRDAKSKKELALHQVQNMLAHQVMRQLQVFARLAERNQQSLAAKKYRLLLELLKPTLSEKAKHIDRLYQADPVHQSILAHIDALDQ